MTQGKKTRPVGIFVDVPTIANKTTTEDSYVTVYSWDTEFLLGKVFRFSATTNTLKVKILGSLDGGLTYPETAEAEFVVTTSTPVVKRISDYYSALRVQVAPNVSLTNGTLTTTAIGSSMPDLADVLVLGTVGIDQTGTKNNVKTITGSLTGLEAGTALIGKVSIDQVTASANEVVVKSITAGDNNIGNVDIVSLPSGNLGQKTSAASLSVTPATNVVDATYIGDIKFGEAPPVAYNAGANDATTQRVVLSTETLTALENITAAVDQTTDGTSNRVVAKISQAVGENHVEILDSSGGGITSTASALDINIKSGTPTVLTVIPTNVSISFADNAAQTIIAAPGSGKRLRITSLFLSSSVNVTIAMKSGVNLIGTIYGQSFDHTWVIPMALGTVEAFILDATSADQIYGQVCYYEESI